MDHRRRSSSRDERLNGSNITRATDTRYFITSRKSHIFIAMLLNSHMWPF